MTAVTIDPGPLEALATRLLMAAGLPEERAASVARQLVETDLLGHATHGVSFLPRYLERIEAGTIAKTGDVGIVADHSTTFAWDGRRLPGAWVMERAIDELLRRDGPLLAATIGNCSHIGALTPYLLPFTERGRLVQIAATDPSIASVAPFGGVDPILTSNPIGFGIPTDGDPILVDQCTSVVSNAALRPFAPGGAREGERLPGAWLLDEDGRATDDPSALIHGTILPVGGADFGYKGYGFGLMVEALSLALSTHGRRSAPTSPGQSVFILTIDPEGLGGRKSFFEETSQLTDTIRASRPVPGQPAPRLPGERALAARRRSRVQGVTIGASTLGAIRTWAQRLDVSIANLSEHQK